MIYIISWSHTPKLSLCIHLVIAKYELKSQYAKLSQLWHFDALFQFYNIFTDALSII